MLAFNVLIIVYVFFISRNIFSATPLKSWYYPLLLLKIMFGLAYAALYTFYYTQENDSICYHHDGLVFSWYFWHEPIRFFKVFFFNELECPNQALEFWMFGLDRSFFMSKFISVYYIFLSQNYWIVTVYSAMLNFVASYYLCNEIAKRYPDLKYALIFSFLTLPSIQIWTSGLLKESYAVACIYVCIAMYLNHSLTYLTRILVSFAALFVLYKMKSYYLIFVPFIVLHYLYNTFNKLLLSVYVILFVGMVGYLCKDMLEHFLLVMLYSHDVSYYSGGINSNSKLGNITTDLWTLIKNAPYVVFNACFEPRQFWNTSGLRVVEGLSNILVLCSAVISLTLAFIYKMKPNIEVCLLLGYVVVSAFVIGLTVPNLGTMVRIRVFYYPFLVLLATMGPFAWTYLLMKNKSNE